MHLRSSCTRMGWRLALTTALVLAGYGIAAAQVPRTAERRVALVVGNNAYPETPLRNAVSDADAISSALTGLGFQVTRVTDVSLPRFERAVGDFAASLSPADVALFYFSGHGVQVDNENYLIPIDFAGSEADVKYKAYSATRVHDHLARARVRLLILDACRNNPFGSSRRLRRGGLASMEDMSTTGSMIAFATGPGQIADDNVGERNGLFTKHLLAALAEPGVPAYEIFRRVRARVSAASGGKQVPWVWESLTGEFVFRPGGGGAVAGDAELAVWEAIKDNTDPDVFERFLRDYPAGRMRLAAEAKLDAIRGRRTAAPGSHARILFVETADLALTSEFATHGASLQSAGFALELRPSLWDFRVSAGKVTSQVTPTQVGGAAMRSCRASFDVTVNSTQRLLLQQRYTDAAVSADDATACREATAKAVRTAVTAIVQSIRKGSS